MIEVILEFIVNFGFVNWKRFKHWNSKKPAISYGVLIVLFIAFMGFFSLAYR